MFKLFKKNNDKDLYKITYIQSCRHDFDKSEYAFKEENALVKYVKADNVLEAQAKFAQTTSLYPNVMVMRVQKMDIVE